MQYSQTVIHLLTTTPQLERFWMQSNIVVSVLSGCGVWCVYRLSQTLLQHHIWRRVVYAGLTCAALAASLAQIVSIFISFTKKFLLLMKEPTLPQCGYSSV